MQKERESECLKGQQRLARDAGGGEVLVEYIEGLLSSRYRRAQPSDHPHHSITRSYAAPPSTNDMSVQGQSSGSPYEPRKGLARSGSVRFCEIDSDSYSLAVLD